MRPEAIDNIGDEALAPAMVARFELECSPSLVSASTSRPARQPAATIDLVYVSPRSGRAVSRLAGAPYADRLLPLPVLPARGRLPAPTRVRGGRPRATG